MTLIAGIALVLFGYAALTLWVAHVTRAIRRRQNGLAAGLLALPIVLLLVAPLIPAPARILGVEALFAGLTLALALIAARNEPPVPIRETKPSLLHLALLSGSALFLIPFVWLVSTSLKEDAQMTHYPPEWIPTQQARTTLNDREVGLVWMNVGCKRVKAAAVQVFPDGTELVQPLNGSGAAVRVSKADVAEIRRFDPVWRNYRDALEFLPPDTRYGLANLQNTLVYAVMAVIGTVLSSSLVAYSFARLRWPGRDWLFGVVLATMMLPDAVTMMPRFLIFRGLHWIDTLYPLWVPSFFAAAFNVFLLRQFFMGIPQELEDAARIDGAGYFGTYWRVMLPMIKPALAAVTIMTFIGAWKDFLNPLIYISSPEKMPLSYVLQLFNAAHSGEPGMLMAATTLVMLPVVVLFFFTQRYFIEGVTLTGLGGR